MSASNATGHRTDMLTPLRILRDGIVSFDVWLDDEGELLDPVFGRPMQYGTAYHALGRAVLAACGPAAEAEVHAERAFRGVEAALRHLEDPSGHANASGVTGPDGALSAMNHRDFFWPALLRSWRVLKSIDARRSSGIAERISHVQVPEVFAKRPPSNWASVWLAGEAMRHADGLAGSQAPSPAQIEAWIGTCFEHHILAGRGLYQEPGHPNSYCLFTRYHLAVILEEAEAAEVRGQSAFAGRWKDEMKTLLLRGFERSLAVQLSDGSLASAHRSTGQSWTLSCQVAYFAKLMARAAPRGPAPDARRHEQARTAARCALAALAMCQRPEGAPFSPVQNVLEPRRRIGYEAYSFDANYSNLALGLLACAVLDGFADAPLSAEESPAAPPVSLWIDHDPLWRALIHRGPYSVHINAFPAPAYDAAGIVDITFGPGRGFAWASSVFSPLEPRRFFNPGLARREGVPDLAALTVPGQQDLRPIGPFEPLEDGGGVRLVSRVRGDPLGIWDLTVRVDVEAIHVSEATPGRTGPRTMLLPYLRDRGDGQKVRWTASTPSPHTTVIHFTHGAEQVDVRIDAAAAAIIDLPGGFQNRRGECGMLRLELAGEGPELTWHIALVR